MSETPRKSRHFFGLAFFRSKVGERKAYVTTCDNSSTEERSTSLFQPWTYRTLTLKISQNILFLLVFLYCSYFYLWHRLVQYYIDTKNGTWLWKLDLGFDTKANPQNTMKAKTTILLLYHIESLCPTAIFSIFSTVFIQTSKISNKN